MYHPLEADRRLRDGGRTFGEPAHVLIDERFSPGTESGDIAAAGGDDAGAELVVKNSEQDVLDREILAAALPCLVGRRFERYFQVPADHGHSLSRSHRRGNPASFARACTFSVFVSAISRV